MLERRIILYEIFVYLSMGKSFTAFLCDVCFSSNNFLQSKDSYSFSQEIATEVQSESKWRQLGELAMSAGKVRWLIILVSCFFFFLEIKNFAFAVFYLIF